jgi:hypothetical protein
MKESGDSSGQREQSTATTNEEEDDEDDDSYNNINTTNPGPSAPALRCMWTNEGGQFGWQKVHRHLSG